MSNDPQVPWTDEQWARVNQVIQEEARHARVAATFLPLYGPLPADADFVRAGTISYDRRPQPPPPERINIADTHTIQLPTLQVKVNVRAAQMADPDMTSVLALFRRAANVLARLEDAIVFNGQAGVNCGPRGQAPSLPQIWEVIAGGASSGLLAPAGSVMVPVPTRLPQGGAQQLDLVAAVSDAIGLLEADGHFGPFAVALGQAFFLEVQTPDNAGLVLPQDRIIPFLGGGPLLRSSVLPVNRGVVVALGGAPVELVIATDVSLQFLQVTTDPNYLFRVREKMALRIKEPQAIATLI